MSIRKDSNINFRRDRRLIEDAIERELVLFGLDLETTAKKYLADRNVNDENDLSRSIKSEVDKMIDSFRLQFGSNVPHAVFVHEGTKPHWPWDSKENKNPIRAWVARKIKPPIDQIDQVTFLISRKIAREGTKAKPFLTVALRAHQQKLAGRIARSIQKGIHAG